MGEGNLSPRWGWAPINEDHPRLTPWATVFRPSGPGATDWEGARVPTEGNGVSPVELTFEAGFRGGATKGAGSVSFRRGSVLSVVGILVGGFLGRWQRHAMGIVSWSSWRVFEDGGFVGWERRPFATFCDSCGRRSGIEAAGSHAKTRRREGVVGLSFGEDVGGEMRRGGFRTGGSSGIPDRRRRPSFAASRLCGLSDSMLWDAEE
jgi:hypothetical protein